MKINQPKYAVNGSVCGYTPNFVKSPLQAKVKKSCIYAKPHKVKGSGVSTIEVIDDKPTPIFESQNLTAPLSGIFISEFEQTQKAKLDSQFMSRNQAYFASNKLSPAGRPGAEKARLVKERKSPTRTKADIELTLKLNNISSIASALSERGFDFDKSTEKTIVSEGELGSTEAGKITNDWSVDTETGELKPKVFNKTAVARLAYRAWSDEYRLRVTTDASPSKAPPQQVGDRVTKFLTTRAAKNILDSGAYVSAVREGYTTFLTLTFSGKARRRIINGDSTIGAECSRFFDALQKMYQRGWIAEKFSVPFSELKTDMISGGFECVANDEEIIPESGESLDYLWVAEAPAKAKIIKSKTVNGNTFDCVDARPNPHCHVLLRWQVPPHLFRAWAARIERMWGQGFAKLERIKNADAASGYMLKALGYLLKSDESGQNSQGTIKGNRYNISKSARALPWENVANYHAQHMASIIGEIKAKLQRKAAPTVHAIKATAEKIKGQLKIKSIAINQGKETKTIDARIKHYERQIQKHKAHLRRNPVRANDYMISFKGYYPLKRFLNWCVGLRFWDAVDANEKRATSRLPENLLTQAVGSIRKSFSKVRNRLVEVESYWRALLSAQLPPQVDLEKIRQDNFTDSLVYEKACFNVGGM